MINEIAVRLYRRLFGVPAGTGPAAGADQVLDGNSAVALTEAALADAAALSNATSASGAELAWQQALQRMPVNSFGIRPEAQAAEGPRGAFAVAMGQSMAGLRTTLFLAGPDLAAVQDLLANAASRHLPLVIHLDNQALPAQGVSRGSDHRALHMAAESGAVILLAENVQQAVDFTLIARRLAETALLPVVVAMDGEGTARSLQELRLVDAALIRDYIGGTEASVACPTPAQQLLFGDSRRRLPRWHDLDRPLQQGSLQAPDAYAQGVAGNRPFFDDHLPELLRQAQDAFARLTGRRYRALSSHRVEDARLLLLVQGSAVEQVRAVADRLRQEHKMKVGVVGINSLRPFPHNQLLERLKGRRQLLVLERLDTPLAGDAPLLREVRATLAMALENRRHGGAPPYPAVPALDQQQLPRPFSVLYGLGGLALDSGDLITCCRDLDGGAPSVRYLGIDFHGNIEKHPKRQVLLDQVRRAYPGIERLGVRARDAGVDLRGKGALALAVLHRPVHHAGGILPDCAGLLHRLAGGWLRSLPDSAWDEWNGWRCDRLIHGAEGAPLPAEGEKSLDFALITADEPLHPALLARLRQGAGLLVCGLEDPAESVLGQDATARSLIERMELRLFRLPAGRWEQDGPGESGPGRAERQDAYRLGGAMAAMQALGLIGESSRRIQSAWESGLAGLSAAGRDALTAALDAGMTRLEPFSLAASVVAEEAQWRDQVPAVVRQLGGSDETLFSLPRFWDQVGILYREGEQEDLTADPFMTVAAVPPLSSTFRSMGPWRRILPEFNPELCTACGDCWTACPDSAIAVAALTPSTLVDSGIRLAGADALRQVGGKLAARISALGRKGEITGATAGALLQRAWDWLQEKAPLPEGRREAVQEAFAAVVEQVGPLPLAQTDLLFQGGERLQKDGGELLSLVIDPDACKGCGLCLAACEAQALTPQPQTAALLEQAGLCWRIWEQMPDTASSTIERLGAEGDMNGLAALLMSRHCAMAVAGGDGSEAGSGEKIALRLALAATEYHQQPRLSRFNTELAALLGEIETRIRDTLTDALPTDDLDTLLNNLGAAGGRQIDLSTLTRGSSGRESSIDADRLGGLIELASGLRQAHWQLSKGDYGLGRARFGLALVPGSVAAWAGVFPNNPFHAPVTLDMTGDGAQMAVGLLQGQLAEMMATLNLARRARAALDDKQATAEVASCWQALTDEERALCPPLILVGSERELGGRGLAQVAWLLNSGLPLKVLLLSSLDLGLAGAGPTSDSVSDSHDPRTDLLLMALAQRDAYVAQCAIAEPDHYRQCLKEALGFSGPALIRLHAPSPLRHGFAADQTLRQSRLALLSRAFPLLRYNPEEEGVFGSRISLAGNPHEREAWAPGDDGAPFTPLDWMLSEQRFADHFSRLEEDDPPAVPVIDWLALAPAERQRKTPVVRLTDEAGTALKVSVDAAMQMGRLGHIWRTLQELAGLVTPFTERVRQEAEQCVANERAAEIAALKAEYERRMAELQSGLQGEIAGQIRQRLLHLAGYE